MAAGLGFNAFWTFIANTAISYAVSSISNKLFGPKTKNNSPTYAFGTLQTQTNSGMVMALPYGRVKCAGNLIWSSGEGKVQHKIISFGVGKIKGFIDVKGNDMYLETKYEQRPALSIVYNGSSLSATVEIHTFNGNQSITCDDGAHAFSVLTRSTLFPQLPNEGIMNSINANSGWHCEITVGGLCNLIDLPTTNVKGIPCTIKYNAVIQEGLPGCSYTAYIGDGDQLIDNRVTGATQEDKAKLVGGLKYDAYLAITATASEKLTGDYNTTAIVEGRIVKIYTSPTTYYEDWSDNPAWCFLDFMTSVDGCGMKVSENDIHGFLSAAAYYNELVNGKKRFTFNMIMDEKKSRQDWLDEILITCRSYRTYQRGLHGILVDKPENISQIFEVKPDESIETWWQDNAEDVERLQIEYIDPSYEYTKVVAQADRVQLPGETSQFRNKSPLTKKISIYGIDNFEQASREAWFHLNKAQTCPEWTQYTTNKRALNRSIGDVVGVWNPITEVVEQGLAYKRYRIMSMTEPQENKITMVMQEYNPNLYGDTMGSVAPTINITKLPNQYSTPPDVTDLKLTQKYYRNADGTIISNIYGTCVMPDYRYFNRAPVEYSTDGGVNWQYVISIHEGDFIIPGVDTGKTYIIRVRVINRAELWSTGVISEPIYITGKDDPPAEILSLSAIQDPSDSTKLIIVWPIVNEPDIRGYEIRIGENNWDNATPIKNDPTSKYPSIIFENKYIYTLTKSGIFNLLIKAVDNSGNYSEFAAGQQIKVKIEPPDVTGFVAYQNGGTVSFAWDKIIATDTITYEVREGSTFERGIVVATGITGTIYNAPIDTEKTTRYFIKSCNRAGIYSINAVSQIVEIKNLPNKNVIQSFNEFDLLTGTHLNTMFTNQVETCLTLGVNTGLLTCNKYPESCNSFANTVTLQLKLFPVRALLMPFFGLYNMYASSGTYETKVKDMGKIISANISSNFISDILTNDKYTAKIQFATSIDGNTFTEWTDLTPRTLTFRYVKFRAYLATLDIKNTPEVFIMIENIDVPDTSKTGTATIPVGGAFVFYNYEYHTQPAFNPTAIGAGLICEIISISINKAFIKVVNRSTGTDVGGNITWASNGY